LKLAVLLFTVLSVCAGCNEPEAASDSESISRDLICEFGYLSVKVPDGWSCTRSAPDYGVELNWDSSQHEIALMISPPAKAPLDLNTDLDWIEHLRLESKAQAKEYKTMSEPAAIHEDHVTIYFIEGLESSAPHLLRRHGYLVRESRCAKFVLIRPPIMGEDEEGRVQGILGTVWDGVSLD
jgi:hypothetical protein